MTEHVARTDEKTEKRIRRVLYTFVGAAAALFFYVSVLQNLFGGTLWDRGMYGLGTALLAALLCIWIHSLPFMRLLRALGEAQTQVSVIQIGCFACICLMTLYYYNSGSEYGHSVATRVMNCSFGIALLLLYQRQERGRHLIRWTQDFAAVVFIVGSFLQERNEKEMVMYLLSALTVWIYCAVLGCLAVRIRHGEVQRSFSAYGWLVLALFTGMVLFRNTRTWPFSVVIPFGSLYLTRFTQQEMNRFLGNFCYGCLLAFWLMFGSGILFRPYYSFEFVRYPGWFNSVATAGLFWLLVFGCSVSCLLAKYSGPGSIRNCLYELFTLGAAETYLLMGMSRTSLLGTAVVSVATFLVVEVVRYRDAVRGMAVKAALVICPALVLFPVVYTLTRCIPAVVARPVWITGAEWFSDRIQKKEPADSSKYMNVPQLGESLLEKLFGIEINLSALAGAVSGPGDGVTIDENGEITVADNVVDYYIKDGQIYTVKDYTFSNEDTEDVSNGRFDIFRLYYHNLNLTGHDSMLVEDVDENITLYHAHNSYMQAAHDHGIPTGLLFVLVVFLGVPVSIIYYKKNYFSVSFAIFPVIVVISFMIAGMTEWVFHPSIPIGFAFLIGLTPLMAAKEPVCSQPVAEKETGDRNHKASGII